MTELGIPAGPGPVTGSSGIQPTLLSEDTGSEVFLQLLVTQIRNQDPLSPLEPTQFVSQLAEFSSLEQLLEMRESLEAIQAELTENQGSVAHSGSAP